MSRASLQGLFQRIGDAERPVSAELKEFAPGVRLHPLIKPFAADKDGNMVGGGCDNSKTVFGFIQPSAQGKTLIFQIAEDTEDAIKKEKKCAIDMLQRDLKKACAMWDKDGGVPHDKALESVVRL